jgi:hypothetical protein
LFDWPAIYTDLDTMVASMDALMVHAAQALQFTKPKRHRVAAVILTVVHDFGDGDDAAFGPA